MNTDLIPENVNFDGELHLFDLTIYSTVVGPGDDEDDYYDEDEDWEDEDDYF